MMKLMNKIFASKFWWLLLLAVLFVINFLASQFHARFDLTKEKRYTLSKATRSLVKGLEEDVQIDVFLKGVSIGLSQTGQYDERVFRIAERPQRFQSSLSFYLSAG